MHTVENPGGSSKSCQIPEGGQCFFGQILRGIHLFVFSSIFINEVFLKKIAEGGHTHLPPHPLCACTYVSKLEKVLPEIKSYIHDVQEKTPVLSCFRLIFVSGWFHRLHRPSSVGDLGRPGVPRLSTNPRNFGEQSTVVRFENSGLAIRPLRGRFVFEILG
jgi:hypothetical protein